MIPVIGTINYQPGTFNRGSWNDRKRFLGNTAEAAFEKYADLNGLAIERFGMDAESPLTYRTIHPAVRQRPDYICQIDGTTTFAEVKGSGRDQIVKIKHSTMESTAWWEQIHPVNFFIFDSSRNLCTLASLNEIRQIIQTHDLEPAKFSDGNEFWPIPADALTWEPLTVGGEA